MQTSPGPSLARCTNAYPWKLDLPFNPNSPFSTGGLGCLCGGTSDPTAATLRYLVSSGAYTQQSNQAAGSLEPVANPSDLGAGSFWYQPLERADIVLIRPYLILYSSSGHTAHAAAASAAGITANFSFFLVKCMARGPGTKEEGEPVEFTAEFKGMVTCTNAATRVASTARKVPTGLQWCDVATVVSDESIDPGIKIDGDVAGGALHLRMDQEGALGLITYVTTLTTNAGGGWLRSHL